MYKCYACEEKFTDPMLRTVHASTHPDNLIAGVEITNDYDNSKDRNFTLKDFEDDINENGYDVISQEEDELSRGCDQNKIGSDKGAFVCGICNKRFGCSSSLQRHNRLHKGNLCYKCAICEKTFTRTDTFNIHGMKHIQNFNGLECPLSNCTVKGDGVEMISQHIKLNHTDEVLNCKECGKCFTRSENLMIHYYNFHGPLKINRTLCKV
uniref:C2H2-type domain-containing protein n=1 Tax=Parastrongyloides trichosuri TaxID=131310 RepID=A0A0N4Z6U1_PARTI